jgi:Amt family ammonium transporter
VVRALSPTDAAPNKVNGLFYGGGFDLLGIQTVATVAVLAYSFAVTWVIAKVLNITVGLRIDEAAELRGIDMAAHSESAYLMDEEPVELGSPHRV